MFPQAELLGLPDMPASKAASVERRRAGRPPGSRNRRDEDAARVAVERFGDPLLHQVAIATMDVEELASRAGCTVLEAMVEKRLAAMAVLPFLHSKRPLAVDVTNRRVVHLTIVESSSEVGEASTEALEAHVVESLEYQHVSEGESDAV
jgi:hypothetical protein